MSGKSEDDIAIENFRAYLRIPSVQPNVDYSGCVEFLTTLADEIGIKYKILELTESKPIIIMTIPGTIPSLPAIALNSHMDVVPVFPESWHHDPFGAEMDDQGNIYARGAQDMKCLSIEYLEALRKLLKEGQKFKRTIHVLLVPDEEDGIDGVDQLTQSPYLDQLNIGFVLDEGDSNATAAYKVYYAEKAIWHAKFHVSGTDGHGSLPLVNTAGEKMRRLIDLAMDYRQKQLDKLEADPTINVGEITFINLTELSGGKAPNVVPPELTVTLDMRLAVDEDHQAFEEMLESWCDKAGGGVTIEYIAKEPATPPTAIDDTNPYWRAMQQVFSSLNQEITKNIMPGGTDSRFLRRAGIPCICFSPNNYTEDLAHANDEYLNKDVFLRGIVVYYNMIPALANLD